MAISVSSILSRKTVPRTQKVGNRVNKIILIKFYALNLLSVTYYSTAYLDLNKIIAML